MRIRFLLVTLLLVTGGCASQLPIAATYPISTQRKAKAAHHWDVLADDIALQTQIAAFGKDSSIKGQTLYVRELREKTQFNQAFRNFLITRLVNRGLQVSDRPEAAVVIDYDTQLIRHASNRYTHVPGTLTALTSGLWVIHDIIDASSSAAPGSIALAAVADWGLGYYAGGASHTELIVTTSIVTDNQYRLRKSSVYYIEEEDADLFVEALERPTKRMEVVGR